MSNNHTDTNQTVGKLTHTVRRTEIIEHLTNFRCEVDKSIHALPGIMLGVSCASVIQTSMALIWHIDVLKGALIEAMLREGLNPLGDGNVTNETTRPRQPATTGSRTDYPPLQRANGHTLLHSSVRIADPAVNSHVAYDPARSQVTIQAVTQPPAARYYHSTGEQVVPDRPPGNVTVTPHYTDPYATNYSGYGDQSVPSNADLSRYRPTPASSTYSHDYHTVDATSTPSTSVQSGASTHYAPTN